MKYTLFVLSVQFLALASIVSAAQSSSMPCGAGYKAQCPILKDLVEHCDETCGGVVTTCETCSKCLERKTVNGVDSVFISSYDCKNGDSISWQVPVYDGKWCDHGQKTGVTDSTPTSGKWYPTNGLDSITIDKHDGLFKQNSGVKCTGGGKQLGSNICRQIIPLNTCGAPVAPVTTTCLSVACDKKAGVLDTTECVNCAVECCKPTCATASCDYGLKSGITIASSCTDCNAECCEVLKCTSASCSNGYKVGKTDSSTCSDCDAECCADPKVCSSATCSDGYKVDKTDSSTCSDCDAECCADPKVCSSASCSNGYKDDKTASSTCSDCDAECCKDPKLCSTHSSCPNGYKAGKNDSSTCSDCIAECCAPEGGSTCASVQCAGGYKDDTITDNTACNSCKAECCSEGCSSEDDKLKLIVYHECVASDL